MTPPCDRNYNLTLFCAFLSVVTIKCPVVVRSSYLFTALGDNYAYHVVHYRGHRFKKVKQFYIKANYDNKIIGKLI